MPSVYNTARRDLVDVGVDWLTASTAGKKQYKKASDTAERLLSNERDKGNVLRHATVEGYAGYQCGQVFAGALAGTMLMRLSGGLAAEHWREVYDHSTNVSRLDLQATVRYTPEVPTVAERVERDVLKKLGDSKLPLDVGIVRSRKKGSTCVIGRRVSDRYARVYDKRRESNSEAFAGCWRGEVELKRALAARAAKELRRSDGEHTVINDYLLQTFRRYGAGRLWATIGRQYSWSIREPRRQESDQVLAWLQKGVSGRVSWLIQQGRLQDVVDALGLSECVTINQDQATEE